MPQLSNGWIILPLLATVAVGLFIWKKKRLSYVKVGRINKILFYPVKSLKGIELSEAVCNESGIQLNGLFERSFMLMTKNKDLLSMLDAPTLSLLTPKIIDSKLIISGPDIDPLILNIDSTPDQTNEIIPYSMEYRMNGEITCVVDCGDYAAKWFQNYLNIPDIRLVRFFPQHRPPLFKSLFSKLKSMDPKVLQDLAPIHIMSQSSIDDLNSRLIDRTVTHVNFRPNILIDQCCPFAEDSWKFIKFGSEVEMENVIPVARCLMTTMEPDQGILTQKEPMVTLRKYRIPTDPKVLKITGSVPCFGRACFLLRTGTIKVNDDVFAAVFK